MAINKAELKLLIESVSRTEATRAYVALMNEYHSISKTARPKEVISRRKDDISEMLHILKYKLPTHISRNTNVFMTDKYFWERTKESIHV